MTFMARMPREVQERLMANPMVTICSPDGRRVASERRHLDHLTLKQCELLFGEDDIRTEAEQRELVQKRIDERKKQRIGRDKASMRYTNKCGAEREESRVQRRQAAPTQPEPPERQEMDAEAEELEVEVMAPDHYSSFDDQLAAAHKTLMDIRAKYGPNHPIDRCVQAGLNAIGNLRFELNQL